MPIQVASSAQCFCSMGVSPGTLNVLDPQTLAGGMPAANIMDKNLGANFIPTGTFGSCRSMAYPPTAAATAAQRGILTPQSCVPSIPGPWAPGAITTLVNGQPALNNTSVLQCAFGGTITILNPACFTVMT